jgi:hypothetical protein
MSAKLSRYGLEISKACRRFSNELQKSKKRVDHSSISTSCLLIYWH